MQIYKMWSKTCDYIVSPALSRKGMLKEIIHGEHFLANPTAIKNCCILNSIDLKPGLSIVFSEW